MKKRMTIMITTLIIVFGGIIGYNLLTGFFMRQYLAHYEPPAVAVSSTRVFTRDWYPHIAVVGNFVAINGVEVNSEASGSVTSIFFESGQYIAKDQPLIQIEDSVDRASLKYNQSELALQEINYHRQLDLLKRNATSTSSVDSAKAQWLEAQANVEKIDALIKQKHITAPFSGRLGIRQINLGQYITPGQTSIVSLQSLDPLYLEFYLPEQLLTKIQIGQKIQFRVEHNPGKWFEGKITAINAKVDLNTHNILVQATLPNCSVKALSDLKNARGIQLKKNPDGQTIILCDSKQNEINKVTDFNFIPGMFADIEIEQPPLPNVTVLPTTAISYSLYGNSVFVIEKKDKKDDQGNDILTVRRVFVKTGDQAENYTVILSGLDSHQLVVGSGEFKLQNGTRVTINNDVQLKNSDINQLGE